MLGPPPHDQPPAEDLAQVLAGAERLLRGARRVGPLGLHHPGAHRRRRGRRRCPDHVISSAAGMNSAVRRTSTVVDTTIGDRGAERTHRQRLELVDDAVADDVDVGRDAVGDLADAAVGEERRRQRERVADHPTPQVDRQPGADPGDHEVRRRTTRAWRRCRAASAVTRRGAGVVAARGAGRRPTRRRARRRRCPRWRPP